MVNLNKPSLLLPKLADILILLFLTPQTYNSLFIETSAKSGDNVTQAFTDMAKLLWEKEDQDIEKALTLDDGATKSGCCS